MLNKKFIALVCIALAAGLLIGLISFRGYFISSREYISYPVEFEIVHAYFKVFNVTRDSGIGYSRMVSYVIVLNITNLSDAALTLGELQLSSGLFHYVQYFSDHVSENVFYPHTSRFAAFSQTGSISAEGRQALEWQTLDYGIILYFSATEGRGGAGGAFSRQMSLKKISQDEFVYGSTFKPGSYLFFNNEGINIGTGTVREGTPR